MNPISNKQAAMDPRLLLFYFVMGTLIVICAAWLVVQVIDWRRGRRKRRDLPKAGIVAAREITGAGTIDRGIAVVTDRSTKKETP